MVAWILIYWLTVQSTGTVATGTVPFNDEAACRSAFVAMRAAKPEGTQGLGGVCVPQSSR